MVVQTLVDKPLGGLVAVAARGKLELEAQQELGVMDCLRQLLELL
jgi:hypothetical protein